VTNQKIIITRPGHLDVGRGLLGKKGKVRGDADRVLPVNSVAQGGLECRGALVEVAAKMTTDEEETLSRWNYRRTTGGLQQQFEDSIAARWVSAG
jgi:hypothetical protein